MGVPKFFRFISERYPCLSEVVKESEIPEFDNFYIDANGIIHNCSHPDDSIHFRISEEEIFKEIFYYLEVLFRLIKPKKLFFIAIDGVAPRAKMNQQRGRRFRTATDAEKAIESAKAKGEVLPDTERFDSNCITPGTEFMEKLHRQLQYFIKKKISTDDLWQRPKVILSGHNVPGEGEHKIMDYIRYLRTASDWDPNTRHCLHGLDADLMMLGLATHEPHFSLLREEIKFGRQAKRKTSVEETKFFLLHLSLMRDYLDLEFQELKDKLPFPYDLERIIDDWVLMGFLVGNDFIPNLPNFHIANNALHVLYRSYIEVLPTLDGYINNFGRLNLERFEKYLEKLAKIDYENFKDVNADLKYFKSKTGRHFPGTGMTQVNELDPEGLPAFDDLKLDAEILALSKETDDLLGESDTESEGSDTELLREEFRMYKADFYKYKLEYETVDKEVLMDQAEGYIRAIQWNLLYYYVGCPSWSWYYPHHYSPFVSDIKGFSNLDLTFPPSKPFLPFQQLLAVLPAASKKIVPKAFQDLMTSPESPIIKFYPEKFETDLNGKQHDWEAVVLIPFIDENILLAAMDPHYKELTEDENNRNIVKPMELYQYTPEDLGKCEAPEYFPPIHNLHVKLTEIWSKDILVSPDKVVKGRLPGSVTGGYLGFPHLLGIPFTARLEKAKVRVFDHPSRGENMILKIKYKEFEDDEAIERVVHELLGQVVFVGWPHIQRSKVIEMTTAKYQYRLEGGNVKRYEDKDIRFNMHSEELQRTNKNMMGIETHKVQLVLYVKTVEDKRYKYHGKTAKLEYLWSCFKKPFPYQTMLKVANLLDTKDGIGEEVDLSQVFTPKKQVFVVEPALYGQLAEVQNIAENGYVKVEVGRTSDLDLTGIMDISHSSDIKYYPGSIAAQRLGIGSHLFSRVTGSIFIQNIENDEKLNVGLALKFTKQGDELVGFTKKEGNMWLYSEKTINLLDQYMAKFPELFEYLQRNSGDDIFFNQDVFPEKGKEKLAEIREWLKSQEHTKAERRPSGAKLLTPQAVSQIEARIHATDLRSHISKEILLLHPSKLYIPVSEIAKGAPDSSTRNQLLDRVVSVRRNYTIPLALRGTIIGFDKTQSNEDSLYDILFDEEVVGGRSYGCTENRVYKLPAQAFLNITQGRRGPHYQGSKDRTSRKMDYMAKNKDEGRIFHSSPKVEVFLDNQKSQGVNKVQQFFDVYRTSNKETVEPRVGGAMPGPGRADTEFHAMWQVLQNTTKPGEGSLRPGGQLRLGPEELSKPSVETALLEQTNALKKLLNIKAEADEAGKAEIQTGPVISSPLLPSHPPPPPIHPHTPALHPSKPCGHVSCYSDLVQVCASKGVSFPLFDYKWIQSSGVCICTITFPTLNEKVVGDSCFTQEESAENASCKAVRLLTGRSEEKRGPPAHPPFPQPSLPQPAHLPARIPQPRPRHPPPQVIRCGTSRVLPSPPTQWWMVRPGQSGGGPVPHDEARQQQQQQQHQQPPARPQAQQQGANEEAGAPAPRINTLIFRPSQVNPLRRQHHSQSTSHENGESDWREKRGGGERRGDRSGPRGGRGRARIAANFSIPLRQPTPGAPPPTGQPSV